MAPPRHLPALNFLVRSTAPPIIALYCPGARDELVERLVGVGRILARFEIAKQQGFKFVWTRRFVRFFECKPTSTMDAIDIADRAISN